MLAAISTTPAISNADGAAATCPGRAAPGGCGMGGVARVEGRAGNSVTVAS
jgi:hypothetical protein